MVAIASGVFGCTVWFSVFAVEHRRLAHDTSWNAKDEVLEVWMRMHDTNMTVSREWSIFEGMLCVESGL